MNPCNVETEKKSVYALEKREFRGQQLIALKYLDGKSRNKFIQDCFKKLDQ